MEAGRQNLVADLIEAGVMAGGYSALARQTSEAAPSLLRWADRYSARAATLARRICSGAYRNGGAPAAISASR